MNREMHIEYRIVAAAVDGLLDSEYSITVWDGEENIVVDSRDRDEILSNLWATDEETLIAWRRDLDGHYRAVGSVLLIHGNDGDDVIADYSPRLEGALAAALAMAQG